MVHIMRKMYLFTIAILLVILNCVIGDNTLSTNSTYEITSVKNDSNANITNMNDTVGTGSFNVTSNIRKFVLKPTFTRTELKVSRSLNPESMQTLNVRTNNGGTATILVKKRDGKTREGNSNSNARPPLFYDVSNQYSRGEVKKGMFGPVHERVSPPPNEYIYPKAIYGNWAAIPSTKLYHRNPTEAYRFAYNPNDQKSISLINSFMKHVEKIEGRNKQSNLDDNNHNDKNPAQNSAPMRRLNVPDPVVISSDMVFVKQQQDSGKVKRGKSLMEISEDGIPLIHGVREPDDENDKRQTWRNARVINGELVPYEKGYTPPRTIEYGDLTYPIKKSPSPASKRKSIGPFTTTDNFSHENVQQTENSAQGIGPFSVKDNLFSSRNVHIRKGSIGPFSVSDNSRNSNAKLIDYIKRINDQELRKDYFVEQRHVNFPGEQTQQPKIQRRMLTQVGNQEFPISSKYTYAKEDDSEVQSMNGPVLQYAHPEFGVQAADIQSKNNKNLETAETGKPGKVEYYTKPQMNRPYRVDPASLNTREVIRDIYSFPPQNYHMKAPPPPATYPYNYGFIRRVRPEKPLWMKITDGMRNSFTQVTELTRPVIDPIVEASQKISENLGFRNSADRTAQEKVGVVYPSSGNLIIPAIGLLAGGTAIGLGALGWRIFDYANLGSLLQRSDDDFLNMEHKRTLNSIQKIPTTTLYLVQDEDAEFSKRQRRNLVDNKNQKNNYVDIYQSSSSSIPTSQSYPVSHSTANNNKFVELIAIPFSTTSQTSSLTSTEISPGKAVKRNKRTRRSIDVVDDSLGSILQDIQRDIPRTSKNGFEEQIRNTNWHNSNCAKQTFCTVMIQNTHDQILLMEKKMFKLLETMHPSLRTSLKPHLTEVTDAIRKYDCTHFVCYQNQAL